MKPEEFYKKEECVIYCPQKASTSSLFSGKMEIKLQDRRDGKLFIFIDFKEEPNQIKELKGERGIDKEENVF